MVTQNGDSETRLIGTPDQVIAFADRLKAEAEISRNGSGLRHISETFEQTGHNGPWRLIISVMEDDE